MFCALSLSLAVACGTAHAQANSPGSATASDAVKRYQVDLGFDQAEISGVVSQVLGDVLARPYRLDPDVKGTISLRANGDLTADDILSLLSRALSAQGFALIIQSKGDIVIVPAAKAQQAAPLAVREQTGAAAPPGYSTLSIRLKIAKTEDVTRALQVLTPSVQVLLADPANGSLILGGTREDLQAAQQAIALLDRFQEHNAVFDVVLLQHSSADKLVGELSPVLSKVQAGVVDIVPIARRNAILLVSRSKAALEFSKSLIATFDIEGEASGWRTFAPRHVSAKHLADVLNDVLGEGGSKPASNVAIPSASLAGRVVADDKANLVIARAGPDEWADMLRVLQAADVVPTQVLIEGVIVEVTLTREFRYGLNWNVDLGKSGEATLSDKASGSLAPTFPGLAVAYAKGDVSAVLTALSTKTDVNVVSGPKALALDGETATLQVGSEVPIVTQTAQSLQSGDAPLLTTLSYRNTGVILKVTPHVTGDGQVRIDVAQEVSDVTRTTASGIDSPTFQQRRIETKLLVDDGATVVLGGLISTNDSRQKGGIPIAKDLPVVGSLFSNQSKTKTRTELLVFLTPHIIANKADAAAVGDLAKKDAAEILKRELAR